ncbi:hypothetical protein D9M71_637440 [compost metagenome]
MYCEAARGEVVELVGFKGKRFADLKLSQQEADVKVELAAGQQFLLKNLTLSAIGEGQFRFRDNIEVPEGYFDETNIPVIPQDPT